MKKKTLQIASQSVSVMREKQLSKKGRRAPEFSSNRFVEEFTVLPLNKYLG